MRPSTKEFRSNSLNKGSLLKESSYCSIILRNEDQFDYDPWRIGDNLEGDEVPRA
jgi:hypothetical protein